MRLLGTYRFRPAAGGRGWFVLLLAALFALAGLAHGGPVRPAPAHEAAMAAASMLAGAASALSDHAMDTPGPHLPGQPHDAKAGGCPLCGVLPVVIGPPPGPRFDGAAAPPSSPAAAGLAPPLPPPRLGA